jgi:cytochrome c-type biogenesis protein CcmH
LTLLALLVLAVLALLPLAWVLRRPRPGRSRRESALAIHRAQLAELDRTLAEGRIGPAQHATAVLEVQRRLLAAADLPDEISPPTPDQGGPLRRSRLVLPVVLIGVPLLAAGLYAVDGHPFLPAAPLAPRLAQADRQAEEAGKLVALLRERLATLDQHSEMARQGYVLLGNTEDSLGHLPLAAAAWRQAVEIRFDPGLAALVAEAETRLAGKVSPGAAALFRRALAEGPADAPWRKLAEQRLAEAPGG